MRTLWKVVKVVVGLAIAIPLGIIVLATALGVLTALLGLAILALKIAVFALVAWGLFRLAVRLLRGPEPAAELRAPRELPARDRYYEAAVQELDRELGEIPRR